MPQSGATQQRNATVGHRERYSNSNGYNNDYDAVEKAKISQEPKFYAANRQHVHEEDHKLAALRSRRDATQLRLAAMAGRAGATAAGHT